MATATLSQEATINTSYAISNQTKKQEFPSLQATTYKPTKKDEVINLALNESSFNLLSESQISKIGEVRAELMTYGLEDSTIFVLPSNLRWVFLYRPGMFAWNKQDKKVSRLVKGMKLSGKSVVTISKCFLACVVGDEVLLNDEGEVQIFTLKMTSNKTALIGGYNDKDFGVSRNAGGKTLTALNAGLEAHYKTSGWLTHLVSVDLVAYPYVFTSSSSKESSMGIRFGLEGNARPLSQASQELAFNVCTNPKFQVKFSDPFGLNQKDSADRAVPISEDDIPF